MFQLQLIVVSDVVALVCILVSLHLIIKHDYVKASVGLIVAVIALGPVSLNLALLAM